MKTHFLTTIFLCTFFSICGYSQTNDNLAALDPYQLKGYLQSNSDWEEKEWYFENDNQYFYKFYIDEDEDNYISQSDYVILNAPINAGYGKYKNLLFNFMNYIPLKDQFNDRTNLNLFRETYHLNFIFPGTTSNSNNFYYNLYFYYQGKKWVLSSNNYDDCDDNNSSQPSGITRFYYDNDGDGYGGQEISEYYPSGCPHPSLWVSNNDDCNDYDANYTTQGSVWYRDDDGDGYGDANSTIINCKKLPGYVNNSTDCNDNDETLTGEDVIWYADEDNDGFGNPNNTISSPCPPSGNYIRYCHMDDCPLTFGESGSGCPLNEYNLDDSKNFIYNRNYDQPYQFEDLTSGVLLSYNSQIRYLDGIGRIVQKNLIEWGPAQEDVIIYSDFDGNNRETKSYLPYAKGSNSGDYDSSSKSNLLSFYNTENYDFTSNPYSENKIENSPLKRVIEKGFPGEDWAINNNPNTSNTIRKEYSRNEYFEVSKFSVGHLNEQLELTYLKYEGYHMVNTLNKLTVKSENWKKNQPGGEKLNSKDLFIDDDGKLILKRTYNLQNNSVVELDTYYIYDLFDRLTYVLPPRATDHIEDNTQLTDIGVNVVFPWVRFVEVDAEFADSYERKLREYNNVNLLDLDITNEYNGQGGISITENSGEVILNLNFSSDSPFSLKRGEVLPLEELGEFRDTELGRITGEGYDYIFLIRNNHVIIEGEGEISYLNTTLNSANNISYSKNYSWASIAELPLDFKNFYKEQLSEVDNEDILNTIIENEYQGTGGINIEVDENNDVALSVNLQTNTPIALENGFQIPLEAERIIEDRILGYINGPNFMYKFSIKDNNFRIDGQGLINKINIFFKPHAPPVEIIDDEEVESLCYIYHYDKNNNVIEKKIPEKGWQYYIYDKYNRIVLSQDANLRQENTWRFKKYDPLNRIVYEGTYDYTPDQTGQNDNFYRKQIQNDVTNNLYQNERETELFQNVNGEMILYSNATYPTTNLTLDIVNYFDSFNFVNAGPFYDMSFSDPSYQTSLMNSDGLITGKKVRILGTEDWRFVRYFYDERKRLINKKEINVYSTNELDLSLEYDFTNKVTETEKKIQNGYGFSFNVKNKYGYDGSHRPLYQIQSVDDGDYQLINLNEYNQIGQLVNSTIGGESAENPLNSLGYQKVDFTYNIRGWLEEINPLNNGNLSEGDLFSLTTKYNNPSSGASPLFNGNISENYYITANDNNLRGYEFGYDNLNRLISANYIGNYQLSNSPDVEDYSVNVSYDKNGNIINLERYGYTENLTSTNSPGIDLIDNLNYSYFPLSNKLKNVDDTGYSDGFNDGSNTLDDYVYDSNGNMVKDLNKEITNIEYNYYNFPIKVVFNDQDLNSSNPMQINFIYDAEGNKIKKAVYDNSVLPEDTEYFGGITFKDSEFKYYNFGQGYIAKNTLDQYEYLYNYKDNLGNIRLTYKKNDQNSTNNLDEFTSTIDGWQQISINNDVTLESENGKLSVESVSSGVSTFKVFNISSNNRLSIKFDLDTGSTYGVNFYISEYVNNQWETLLNSDMRFLMDGTFEENFIFSSNKIKVQFVKPAGFGSGTPTKFYIDNFQLKQYGLEIIEEKNYYPFGLTHQGYNNVIDYLSYNKGYLDQEENKELGLNWLSFRHRNYMPEIGRFFGVDPIAEKFYYLSPYQTAHNNPIWKIELEGLEGYPQQGEDQINEQDDYPDDFNDVPRENRMEEVLIVSSSDVTSSQTSEEDEDRIDNMLEWGLLGLDNIQESNRGVQERDERYSARSLTNYDNKRNINNSSLANYNKNLKDKNNLKNLDTALSTVGYIKLGQQGFITLMTASSDLTPAISKFFTFSGGVFSAIGIGVNFAQFVDALNNGNTLEAKRAAASAAANIAMLFGPIGIGIGIGGHLSLWLNPEMRDPYSKPYSNRNCFIAGTKILLNDGKEKNIEDIKKGDVILSVNMEKMKIEVDTVLEIPERAHTEKMVKMILKNGIEITSSKSHPFYIKNKGWSTYVNDSLSHQHLKTEIIEEGDIVLYYEKNQLIEIKIDKIKYNNKEKKMYNIKHVKKNNTFFVNGVLVHNKYIR